MLFRPLDPSSSPGLDHNLTEQSAKTPGQGDCGGRDRFLTCDPFRVRDLRGSRRPAAGGGVCPVTSADGGPVLTIVARCDPVARGPDVAPPWPQLSADPAVWTFEVSRAFKVAVG